MEAGEGAAQAEIVRIRREDGAYRWTVLEALMIYKSATKNILLCEREDIWERKGDRDELLPAFSRSFGISETGTVRPGTIAESSLFRTLCSDSPYLFFWKDRAGRILGASRSLLKRGNFRDLEEVLGKTEEEIGNHIELPEVDSSAVSAPNDGRGVLGTEELTVSGGRLREVKVTRVP